MRTWLTRTDLAAMVPAALLVVISWPTAVNLGGRGTAVGYGLGLLAATLVLLPWATDRLRRAPPWVLPTLVAVCVAGLAAVFVVGFPSAYHEVMGVGSDRSDALDVALSRLAHGLYPYSGTTYLQNPITPLPGALVLAAPFWALTGDASWQNVAFTLLLLPVLNGGWRLRPEPTMLWALTVLGGYEVLRQFVIGDDLVTGAVPALAAVVWTLRAAAGRSTPVLAVAAVVLGVTTCTRPHMALVLVVVVVAVATVAGRRRAVLVGAVASVAWAALIVPFLLGGVGRFSPMHVVAKVTGSRGITVGIVVVALAALALLIVALAVVRPCSAESVGWLCAAVLFAPSVLSLARRLTMGGEVADLTLGAVAVPFAVWAVTARDARVRGTRLASDGAEPERPSSAAPVIAGR